MKIKLHRVHYTPKELKPGVLYVSEEFDTAAHLCVCGCGAKIRTPLGPTEWTFTDPADGPSLYPSVGNWQQACKSHYWIYRGEIIWDEEWTSEQIAAGRREEVEHRHAYYDALDRRRHGILQRFWHWIKSFLRKS
jgi:hypothetical protein